MPRQAAVYQKQADPQTRGLQLVSSPEADEAYG